MDPILLHLRVNHLGVFALPITALLLAFALWRRESRDLWLAAAVVGTLAAAGTGLAYTSGEDAEHEDDRIPQATHELIEEHEDAAKFALGSALLSCAFGWACYAVARKRTIPMALGGAAVAFTVFSCTIQFRTAYLGGHVGHPEIRGERPPPGPHDHEKDHGDSH